MASGIRHIALADIPLGANLAGAIRAAQLVLQEGQDMGEIAPANGNQETVAAKFDEIPPVFFEQTGNVAGIDDMGTVGLQKHARGQCFHGFVERFPDADPLIVLGLLVIDIQIMAADGNMGDGGRGELFRQP